MHFDKLTYDFEAIDDFVLLPAHLERAAFSEPAQYRLRTLYATDPTNPGLYNGPYRISEIVSGSHIVLAPNPFWTGPKAPFGRITVRAIENTAALEANLLSGTIDMVAGEVGLPLDEAIAFDKRHGGEFNIVYKPGLTFEHVDVNLDVPSLADHRVREALLLALDRDAISHSLFGGRQAVADSFVEPLDAGFTSDVPRHPYDPAAAKQLLDDAGWKAQPDGTRRNADGKMLSLELMTTAGNRSRELVEQVLQSQWKKIGVDIRIKNEPARVFFGETVRYRRFELAMYAWVSAPENAPRSIFYSDEIPSAANSYAGQNATGYKSAEMDRIIDALEIELDKDKRKVLWAEAQRLYATNLPSLPLYFRSDAYILPKWLTGVRPTGNQYPTSLWVTDWGVKP
jgi:peptide/nickel transport system substrate-binding protein